MSSFPAQFSSRCLPCDEDIKSGDFIVNHPDIGYVHEECASDVGKAPEKPRTGRPPVDAHPDTMPRGKTAADRCHQCFQVPSSNGVCGCDI